MTQLINHGILDGGGLVTASGTPDMNTHIAAAGSLFQNQSVFVAATSVSHSASDSVLDRWDAVVSDSAGVGQIIQGTLGSPALQPDTQGYQDHAMVFIQAGVTAIDSTVIQDNRKYVLVHLRPYRVSNSWYGTLGVPGNTNYPSLGYQSSMIASSFFTSDQFGIDRIGINIASTSAVSGSLARLGIYQDNGNGNLQLSTDAGTVDITTGGSPTLVINETLTPGWWWFACGFQDSFSSGSVTLVSVVPTLSPIGGQVISNLGLGGIYVNDSVPGGLPNSLIVSANNLAAIPAPLVGVRAV